LAPLTEKHFSGQDVVPQVEIVIVEIPLAVRNQFRTTRQYLETSEPGPRIAGRCFNEKALGDVIRKAETIGQVATEILDTHYSGKRADLEVF
jgi:hypothetical protein